MQYDRLFKTENPGSSSENFLDDVNPDSIKVLRGAVCEPSIRSACISHLEASKEPSSLHFQFERQGYYALDKESTPSNLVFNRVVTLKDAWSVGKDQKARVANERRRGQAKSSNSSGPAADHARVRITAGEILTVKPHPESDTLLITTVECGEPEPRTIVAGIAAHLSPTSLPGTPVLFCSNLKPARVAGTESNGMILGVSKPDGSFGGLLSPPTSANPGSHLSFPDVEMQYDEMMKSKGAQKAFDRFVDSLNTDSSGVVNYLGQPLQASDGTVVRTEIFGGIVK